MLAEVAEAFRIDALLAPIGLLAAFAAAGAPADRAARAPARLPARLLLA